MTSYYTELDEDRGWDDVVREQDREQEEGRRLARFKPAEYAIAKGAAVGTRVVCAACSTPFLKRSYQQAFCSNKGRGNCKDTYWNLVKPRGIALLT